MKVCAGHVSSFLKVNLLKAHHCNRKRPANHIMRDFYYPRKKLYGPEAVPTILGLSASSILRSNPRDLEYVLSGIMIRVTEDIGEKSSKILTVKREP